MRYITNHDVTSSDGSTIDIYKGKQGALAAFVLATYLDGVPLLYNGQEVGSPKKIDFFKKDPVDWTTNPDMLLAYKAIINFRKTSEAIKKGALTVHNHTDIIVFEKKLGVENVMVLVNVRNAAVNYTVPAGLQSTLIDGLNCGNVVLGTQLLMQPYQYLVLKK